MSIKQAYDRDGVVIVRNAIDSNLAAEAVGHCNWLMAKHPELRPEDLHHWLMKGDAFWHRLISDDRLLDIAQQFIGPNIALFASHYICKAPRTGKPVLWHQDGSYWPLDPMEVITIWMACGEADRENGCMRVIPGSQHTELQEMKAKREVESVLGSGIEESLVDESKAVDLELAPGDVSIHHPNVIHGSNANTSDRWRYGLTIRYIPTSTRITEPGAGAPYLLRGDAVPGINEYWPVHEDVEADSYPYRM